MDVDLAIGQLILSLGAFDYIMKMFNLEESVILSDYGVMISRHVPLSCNNHLWTRVQDANRKMHTSDV